MKAPSLTQPWATLISIGAKRIETRSRSTRHRGLIAIHAEKGLGPVGVKPSTIVLQPKFAHPRQTLQSHVSALVQVANSSCVATHPEDSTLDPKITVVCTVGPVDVNPYRFKGPLIGSPLVKPDINRELTKLEGLENRFPRIVLLRIRHVGAISKGVATARTSSEVVATGITIELTTTDSEVNAPVSAGISDVGSLNQGGNSCN